MFDDALALETVAPFTLRVCPVIAAVGVKLAKIAEEGTVTE
jgi:hypothetical protein